MKTIIYDDSGKILYYSNGDTRDFTPITEGINVMVSDSPVDGKYVLNGRLVNLKKMNISIDKTTVSANGLDEVTISNIPIGAKINIDYQHRIIASSDTLTLTFTDVGQKYIFVELDLHETFTVIINAI